MEKLMEKKNLGIPVTILTFFAFLIGYAMTVGYSSILVGVLFAFVVFGLNFDDKVKSAVKQSYILSFVATLIYLAIDVFYQFVDMVSPSGYYDYNKIQSVFNNIHKFGQDIVNVVVIVAYIILMIFALTQKEVKVSIVSNVLGEGTPKPAQNYQQGGYQQPYQQPQYNQAQYQQPQQPPQQAQPQQSQQAQPQQSQQAQPQQTAGQPAQGVTCPKCGKVNLPNAGFCASCGTKLN